ncbi:MAG: hypothetical protein BWY87_00964 [Deltaproteobacteria bacterium ADurb.Bin510]|nr:MAG: hypothetical protein BWY87_00964 [Deltaproteobacteria bacterium ADurb.Bin510]
MITTIENDESLRLTVTGSLTIATVAEDAVSLRQALASDKRAELDLAGLESLDQAGLQLMIASLKTGRFSFKPSPVLTRALLSGGFNDYASQAGGCNE